MITAATIWYGEGEAVEGPGLDMAGVPAPEDAEACAAPCPPGARPALDGPGRALAAALDPEGGFDPALLAPFRARLAALHGAGAEWVQIHEPLLGTGLSRPLIAALREAYAALSRIGPKILLSGRRGAPGPDLWAALSLPAAGLHLDLIAGPGQLRDALDADVDMMFSLGLIDADAPRRSDLASAARWARVAMRRHGAARIEVANAGPLPDRAEDPQRPWLAGRARKIEEIVLTARIAAEGEAPWRAALADAACALALDGATPRAAARV